MSFRIAYMTGQYPRATDTFIQREVAALRQRGVHVETISVRKPGKNHGGGAEQQDERARTFYLLPPCLLNLFTSHAKLLLGSPLRYLSGLRLAMKTRPRGLKAAIWQLAYFAEAGMVASRLRKHGLTHLHNHMSDSSCSVAMLASELGGFPFSFTMHGPREFFEPDHWRLDEKLRRARFVCCISHFCRSQGMIFAPPDKWNRMHIVHCGVDPAQFRPVRHSGPGRRLLFVGRFTAEKGLRILLEAFAMLCRRYPNLELNLAGDGPERAAMEDRARSLGIENEVRFLGFQSQAQVRELLARTDVFALASFAEGVPVVLMEAMAAGVPVVATQIAGIPELVEDGDSGFLVPPGDAKSLADRIGQLLDDPALRNRLAQSAREIVETDFNLLYESQRLCEIMADAMEGRVAPVRPEVTAAPEAAAVVAAPAGVGA